MREQVRLGLLTVNLASWPAVTIAAAVGISHVEFAETLVPWVSVNVLVPACILYRSLNELTTVRSFLCLLHFQQTG